MDFYAALSLLRMLVLDTGASWVRMFIALGISIILSLILGIYAAISERFGRIIIPIVDIFQTLPILAFFPIVIVVFVGILPGYIGINAAVIFLIITSMIWNIIFGVYESVIVLPSEVMEMAELYGLSTWQRFKKIFIPASMPRVVQQSILSWSIGLFYLVTSEIFSTGVSQYKVTYGIGVFFGTIGSSNLAEYLLGIAVFIVFVIATRLLFFKPLENYFSRYSRQQSTSAGYLRIHNIVHAPIRFIRKRVTGPTRIQDMGIRIGRVILKPRLKKNEPKPIYVKRKSRTGSRTKYATAAILLAVLIILLYLYPQILPYEYIIIVNLAFSFARVWFAFLVALAISIPVCVYLIFMTRQTSKYVLLFQIIASIPATILLPLIVAPLSAYQYGAEYTAFIVFFLSSIWYIIFSALGASKAIPNSIDEVKNIFGVRGKEAWQKIYLKAIMPGLITGAVTAIAAEWNASIVAEFFNGSGNISSAICPSITSLSAISHFTGSGNAVSLGIGKLLDISLSCNNITLMLIAIVNLSVMIILINIFVWKRLYNKTSAIYR